MKKTSLLTLFAIACIALAACNAPLATAASGPAPSTVSQPAATDAAQATSGQTVATAPDGSLTYPIVDTAQTYCYDNSALIACPQSGGNFAGQDGNYQGYAPKYQDNGDGTVTDLATGLMWSQSPDFNSDGTINSSDKMTFANAMSSADSSTLAGFDDWRLPTIKELYSLVLFDGTDVSNCMNSSSCFATPFVDTTYFGFGYGDTAAGERVIDAQFWSSTQYVSTTMGGSATAFGYNFADGRIKGYPISSPRGETLQYVRYVRGNSSYGINAFVDNSNGTITDNATGLTWMQADSGAGMNWGDALNYCEGSTASGFDDWRLPSAKELQSIVDYSRSPATTGTAAIDPIFQTSTITAEGGAADYPFYWTSTTHASSNGGSDFAVYISFGTAYGYMTGPNGGSAQLMDVHGAGAQRSDPKSGDASQYPEGHGPQGDVVRVNNYVRCVRGGDVSYTSGNGTLTPRPSMDISSSNSGGQPQAGQTPAGQNQPSGQAGGAQAGQGQQPPQEAITACSGLSSGSSCSINTPNGTVTGTCGTPPNATQLACMPAGGPPAGP